MARSYQYTYGKYENYIRVGNTPETLSNFPTPSTVGYAYHDLDKDPYTDLRGYTHRNRVRHDVLGLEFGWETLGEDDIAFILNALANVWVYVEVIDKHTKQKHVYKMYASDKKFDTFAVWKDESNNWHEVSRSFSVSMVEE